MDLKIKEATLKDLDLWLKWRIEVLDHVFPEMTVAQRKLLTDKNSEYFVSSIPQKSHIATFALINNKIVGTGDICIYSEMPSPDNLNGKCGYLMNIYTLKDYRGQGIASTVVSNLIKKAQELNISKIYLETTKAAQNLYKQLGFTEMKGYMIYKNG